MRAVVYSRVSTDAQERDGTSLGTQESSSVACADAHRWQVVECIRDTASGFSLERPGIERIREMVRRREVDLVLAYAVDRLSRNQNQIGVLFDEASTAGVRLEFVTESFEDTAIGRFILAARAFVAEVEREKIVERTTRGKAQRARSGRIPQGTGRGIYGYDYDPEAGTRRIHPSQVLIVRRIFEEFVGGSGVSRVANGLNQDGIPAFGGGLWHPLTVRRILLNETYTGRTVYCRTRVEASRDPITGKKRRRIFERDTSDWIEVPDATPAIVSPDLFTRARGMLEVPERRDRGRATGVYRLRGRLRCLSCDTPMTGQALGRGRWRYYRCRNSYTTTPGPKCDERYVPRDLLERAVLDELVKVLTDPDRLREEVLHAAGPGLPVSSAPDPVIALQQIEEQQKRLARLFVSGELPDDVLKAEAMRLQVERRRLDGERSQVRRQRQALSSSNLLDNLPAIAAHIATWVRDAEGEDLDILLRALDVRVQASRERAVVEASVPLFESLGKSDLVTIERTWA